VAASVAGRKAKLVLGFLVVALAAPAPLAQAAPNMGGCPQGYFITGRDQERGGLPPSYRPGEEVTTSGYLLEPTAKRSVTLRWKSPEGPVSVEAPVDEFGAFKDLSFTIPEGTPNKRYRVRLEARNADGSMVPGFPLSVRFRVGPPLPGGRSTEPSPFPGNAGETDERSNPGTTTDAADEAVTRREPAAPAAAPVSRAQVPAVTPATPTLTTASAPEAAGSPTRSAPRSAAPQPESTAPRTDPRAAPVVIPDRVSDTSYAGVSNALGIRSPAGFPAGLALLAAALLVGMAGAAAAFVKGRRGPPLADVGAQVRPVQPDGTISLEQRNASERMRLAAMETELQAMLADAAATEAGVEGPTRDRELLGPRV